MTTNEIRDLKRKLRATEAENAAMRSRLVANAAATLPAVEAEIARKAYDLHTSGKAPTRQAAVAKVLEDDDTRRRYEAARYATEATHPTTKTTGALAKLEALALEYQAKGCTKAEAMVRAATSRPDLYDAYRAERSRDG